MPVTQQALHRIEALELHPNEPDGSIEGLALSLTLPRPPSTSGFPHLHSLLLSYPKAPSDVNGPTYDASPLLLALATGGAVPHLTRLQLRWFGYTTSAAQTLAQAVRERGVLQDQLQWLELDCRWQPTPAEAVERDRLERERWQRLKAAKKAKEEPDPEVSWS